MEYITLHGTFKFATFCKHSGISIQEIIRLNPGKTANHIYRGAVWRVK